jgi:hypothetical protein
MNINISDARDLAEYADAAARALLSDTYDAIASDDTSDIDIARCISADALESAAFTNNPLFAQTDDFFSMILTYELICAIITTLTNCAYSDICADY